MNDRMGPLWRSQIGKLFRVRRNPQITATRLFASGIDDRPQAQDEQWHFVPTGKSDAPMQTRLSFVSKDMSEENSGRRLGIRGMSSVGFRLIDTAFLFGPVALFPKTALSWRVPSPEQITPESLELFFMLQPKLDVLIVGVGEKRNVDSVRQRIAPAIAKHRIGYEILPTEEALSIFNFLNFDHRYVAAALYPPEQLSERVTQRQFGEAMHLLEDANKLDHHPMLIGIDVLGDYDHIKDICRHIWGNTAEAKEMETVAKEVKKRRHQEKSEYFAERRKAKELEEEEERKQISAK